MKAAHSQTLASPPSPQKKDHVFLYPLQEPCSCTGIRPNVQCQFKGIFASKPLHLVEASSHLGKHSWGSSKGSRKAQQGLQLSQGVQC